jgi:hypothetical protein
VRWRAAAGGDPRIDVRVVKRLAPLASNKYRFVQSDTISQWE